MKRVVAVEVKGDTPDLFHAVELEDEDTKSLEDLGVKVAAIEEEHSKKGFAFLVPILAGVPEAAVIVGAATLGIVGGAATVVGGRVVNWVWPEKK